MTFEKMLRISCDHPDCDRWVYAHRVQSVQLGRRSIRADGWSFHIGFGDRCPNHQPNHGDMT